MPVNSAVSAIFREVYVSTGNVEEFAISYSSSFGINGKFVGTFSLVYSADEFANLIDPLYTEIEGGVDLIIFASTYNRVD